MDQEKICIQLPDGATKKFQYGMTLAEVAKVISPSLKKKAIAGRVNGQLVDLYKILKSYADVEIITKDSKEAISILRHTTAHVMAQAVQRLYGQVKFGVGPVIENGFYYDMEISSPITAEDLPEIEEEMTRIISENIRIERHELSKDVAMNIFEQKNDHLKLELLNDIADEEEISIYRQGDYLDLCRGPHLPSTGWIRHFKLMSVSGAYWRGDSNNQVLQRIYGIAFLNKNDLDQHLYFLSEAEKRNHRKLGQELDLFMMSEQAPGMPFYLPKGQIIRNELEQFMREMQNQRGYQEVRTPLMMNNKLWEQSGHWDHYKENMYFSEVDQMTFALKPMNCPGHMLIYKNKHHSYRDLPIRLSEFGQVHRHEYSGALKGLIRVRSFAQDDAHIFVTSEQIEQEIHAIIHLIDHIYHTFGFDYDIELSTRPKDSMGDDVLWDKAENALENVLTALNYPYQVNEGDGAFYGPKIDFHIKDALNRSHQCGTIQLDFQMPEKFNLHYINHNNEKQHPVVIHRAIYGSIDRFLGIVIEHFAGAFPLWIAPVQVNVILISVEAHQQYANRVVRNLRNLGIRVSIDSRNEKLGYKIRESQLQKIPYNLVIGDHEVAYDKVNVREYGKEGSVTIPFDEFISIVQSEIKLKSLKPIEK